MVDFDALAATAKRLIEANGRTVTLYAMSETPDNPAEPWWGPDATDAVPTTVIACFVPASGSFLGRSLSTFQTAAQSYHSVALVAALSAPALDFDEVSSLVDDVAHASRVFKVTKVEALDPTTVPLVYVLVLEG